MRSLFRFVVLAIVLGSAGVAQAVVVRRAVAYRPAAVAYRPYHPVARTAAVATTAVVVGSMVNTLPPSCSSVMVGNAVYQQCGSAWYQPRYAGSDVTYVVVEPPR